MAEEAGRTITSEVAARLLMISGTYVRQLAREGWITKKGKDEYELVSCVQGYIRFLKNEERRTTKTAAESRVRDARAREIELRTAQREEKLMEVADAMTVVDEMIGIMRTELGGLPARVTRDLQFRRTIEAAINETLRRIADCIEQSDIAEKARASAGHAVAGSEPGQVGGGQPDASDH